MKIANTRFWVDRDSSSIGIRSSNDRTQPFEAYLNKRPGWLNFYFYETEREDNSRELRLSFKLLWFSLNMAICPLKSLPDQKRFDDRERNWGWSFLDRSMHLNFGRWSKFWGIPFISMVFVKHELLSRDRKRVIHDHKDDFKGHGSYERREELIKEHSSEFPYRYELLTGEAQNVTATVHAERWTRRWKWTPFKQIEDTIDVRFSEEVGPRRGSWKGGYTGCGWRMRKGETIVQCLRRMESERRFER